MYTAAYLEIGEGGEHIKWLWWAEVSQRDPGGADMKLRDFLQFKLNLMCRSM